MHPKSPLSAQSALPAFAGAARIAAATAVVAALAALPARAVDATAFQPAAGPSGYLVTPDADVLPHLHHEGWLMASWAKDPLVLRDPDGVILRRVVEHALSLELSARLGLFDFLEIQAAAPASALIGQGLTGAGTRTTVGIEDPRIGARARFLALGPVTASARLGLDLPLARLQGDTFTDEEWGAITPGVTVGAEAGIFRGAVDVGALLHAPEKTGNDTFGQELTFSVGGEVAAIPDVLAFTADVAGRYGPTALGASSDRLPVEGAVGAKAFWGPLAFTAGVGGGLVPDVGTPQVRVFAGVGWVGAPTPDEPVRVAPASPPPAPAPEVAPAAPAPEVAPPPACEPEDVDGFEDDDGCLDPDNDGDGVRDENDRCPRDPAPDAAGDGCPPTVVVVEREAVVVNERIFFTLNRDKLLPKSYALLDDVAAALNAHPEIAAVRIEGHADATGPEVFNERLSRWRALSVKRYLVSKGVDPDRLIAVGMAASKPLAPNETVGGRAQNRRVEFRIVDKAPRAGSSAAAAAPQVTK